MLDYLDHALQAASAHLQVGRDAGLRLVGGAEVIRIHRIVRPAPGIAGDPHGLQAPLEALRGDVRNWVHANTTYGGVFDLGVAISVAEGQASVATADPAARPIASQSLAEAKTLAQQFASIMPVSRIMSIPGIDYRSIVSVREQYEASFARTTQM